MATFVSFKRKNVFYTLIYLISVFSFIVILLRVFEAFIHSISFGQKVCPDKEPIDVVYTWVNGSDPVFLKDLNDILKAMNLTNEENYLGQRFDDKNELQFSLRSLEKYAPWINHVYIVTNGQIPYWLNLDYEKVTLITHKEIFLDQTNLPTFSSPAIESQIHRIPGLSKNFLYFNDDIFLGQPIYSDDFLSPNNGYQLYLSSSMETCTPRCFWGRVANGRCDEQCNNFDCQYDGGDCDKPQSPTKTKFSYNIKELNFISPNNRSMKSNYHYVKKNYETKLPKFKIEMQHHNAKNYSELVEKHNKEVMMNEKIKRKIFRKKPRKLRTMKMVKHNNTNINFSNQRKDAYGASLQFTNRLFNYKYGIVTREVPSHTPVLINKDIVEDMQKKFFKEVLITAANKLRNYNDLQFSFAYYYFIIHEREELSLEEIFNMFDIDSSKTWSDREVRTLLTRIYQLPLSYSSIEHFESVLSNCSQRKVYKNVRRAEFEENSNSPLPTISKQLLKDCPELGDILLLYFGSRKKYNYRIVNGFWYDYIYFKGLTSNIDEVIGHLDEIRGKPKKFICLNDNLDHNKHSENELINTIINDFYMSFFPFPSRFELPKEYRNRFLHVEQLIEWKNLHYKIKLLIYFLILFFFYLVGFNLCIKKICVLINRLFY